MHDHAIRNRVRAKVDGLHRQITDARSYLANPWIRFGAAVAVGYLFGCNDEAEPEPSKPETIVHAVIRAAAVAFVTSAMRRAMSGATIEHAHN
jgi:hypothetical protein